MYYNVAIKWKVRHVFKLWQYSALKWLNSLKPTKKSQIKRNEKSKQGSSQHSPAQLYKFHCPGCFNCLCGVATSRHCLVRRDVHDPRLSPESTSTRPQARSLISGLQPCSDNDWERSCHGTIVVCINIRWSRVATRRYYGVVSGIWVPRIDRAIGR